MKPHAHRRRVALLAIVLAGFGSTAWSGDAETAVQRGLRVYQRWCIECHGAGPGFMGRPLTGTEALEAKYEGRLPAVLDQRTDLTPAFVRYFVRNGISLMPFFRKTEIGDDDLAALGAYLARITPGEPR